MKPLILLILLSMAFTAGTQRVKKDTAYNKKPYKDRCRCYLPKDPEQLNPYPFALRLHGDNTLKRTNIRTAVKQVVVIK